MFFEGAIVPSSFVKFAFLQPTLCRFLSIEFLYKNLFF